MEVQAAVIEESSCDPFFKLKFSCEGMDVNIKRGYAQVIRKAPKPVIILDEKTETRLGPIDRSKLELELLYAVIDHMVSSGVSRSWNGNMIFGMAQ